MRATKKKRRRERTRPLDATSLSDPIREIHHRVKNNLQVIASILRLQMRREESVAAQTALGSAVNRIMGMVQVHDLLTHSPSATRNRQINLNELLQQLMELNRSTFLLPGQTIRTAVRGNAVWLDADRALSLALVANELIINAFRHAFRGRDEGKLEAEVKFSRDTLTLSIADNGGGLPAEFHLSAGSNLGLRIVHSVVEDDLHGSLTLTSPAGSEKHPLKRMSPSRFYRDDAIGTRAEIRIPLAEDTNG